MSMFLALLAATSAQPIVTIVMDSRHVCTVGRIGEADRARALGKAKRLERKLRKEGKKVRIVEVDGFVTLSHPGETRISVPGC